MSNAMVRGMPLPNEGHLNPNDGFLGGIAQKKR